MDQLRLKIIDIIYYHTTICILLTILGSFIRTLSADNIISLKEIFRQLLISVFMALLTVTYGSITGVSKEYQYLACMGLGILGVKSLTFFTEKVGKTITVIGKALVELGASVEKYSLKELDNKYKNNKPPNEIQDIPEKTWRITKTKTNPNEEEQK